MEKEYQEYDKRTIAFYAIVGCAAIAIIIWAIIGLPDGMFKNLLDAEIEDSILGLFRFKDGAWMQSIDRLIYILILNKISHFILIILCALIFKINIIGSSDANMLLFPMNYILIILLSSIFPVPIVTERIASGLTSLFSSGFSDFTFWSFILFLWLTLGALHYSFVFAARAVSIAISGFLSLVFLILLSEIVRLLGGGVENFFNREDIGFFLIIAIFAVFNLKAESLIKKALDIEDEFDDIELPQLSAPQADDYEVRTARYFFNEYDGILAVIYAILLRIFCV